MKRDNYNYANILDTLRIEQEEISNVLAVFQESDSGASQVQPFAELKSRLRQLMNEEEQTLYPAVANRGDDQSDLVDVALAEHDDIETALVDLETSITTPKITTLYNAVSSHFANERGALFSEARSINANLRHELAMKAGDIRNS